MNYKILATLAQEYEQDTLVLGYCREPLHQKSNLNNKEEILLIEPNKIGNLEEFETILQGSPNLVSIQIGGYLDEEASSTFNLESYAKILQLVTKYCANHLECLTLFVNRSFEPSEDEEQILTQLDDENTHPHAKIWKDFIDAVSPTLKHLISAGTNFTYNIPHFALKRLLENAKNLENIEGSYSIKSIIDTAMDFICLKDEDAAFIISLEIGLDNLSDLSELKEFKNLRHLKLNYTNPSQIGDTLDFNGLEKLSLVSLTITPIEVPVEDDNECYYSAIDSLMSFFPLWKRVEPNKNPIDLKFPPYSKLRTFVVRGLILSETFWTGIEVKMPFLRDFIYQVGHSSANTLYDLSPFVKLECLQYLVLEMPWNIMEKDVIALLQSKRGRFHLDLYDVQENYPVKNFGKIVDFLSNDEEWLKERRDKFGLAIEYPNYKPEGEDSSEANGFNKQFTKKGLEIHWGKDEEIGTWILKAEHTI